MNINYNGIYYFIKIVSIGKDISYLPIEIRKIIWNKYFSSLIICVFCKKVVVNFECFILDKNINENENFSIINGTAQCWNCKIMEEIMF